jgi:hypothetical protein
MKCRGNIQGDSRGKIRLWEVILLVTIRNIQGDLRRKIRILGGNIIDHYEKYTG